MCAQECFFERALITRVEQSSFVHIITQDADRKKRENLVTDYMLTPFIMHFISGANHCILTRETIRFLDQLSL